MTDRRTEVLADGFHFLEGPRWRDGALWMSDIGGSRVIRLFEDGRSETVVEVPGSPSGLGFLPDGTPIVVSVFGKALHRIVNGKLAPHADVSHLVTSPINDMVVDARGRAYVGCMGYDLFAGEAPKPGVILLVEPNGSARIVAEDMTFPNGSVITRDGRLVVGESFGNRLTSFRIADDGSLADRKVEAALEGSPDGICLDTDGGIWVAMLDHGCVRIKDGRAVDRVPTGERKAIACQLGGTDGRTLFVLTFAGAVEDIGKVPGARVDVVRVDAPAAGSP
jgi:sugar lactone lactonase YvrE